MRVQNERVQKKGLLNDLSEILKRPVPGLSMLDNILPLSKFGSALAATTHNKRGAKEEDKSSKTRQFILQGKVERGTQTTFAVEGQDFVIDGNTWILGELSLGSFVRVKGTIKNLGERCASSIVVSDIA